ncbi:MAG: hypothetical protein LQ349_005748 [Xanthoria aureola]|nr:MAG: hypothetical protein LQ349_005748 [Xanthoria aureola]
MYFPYSLFVLFFYFSLPSLSFPFSKRTISDRPAIASNFPDPAFLEVDNIFYAFSTTNGKQNVPVATSPSFTTDWTILQDHDALPELPGWTTGNIWAPSITRLPSNGLFILYFSGTDRASGSGKHCIGAATSRTITGPYSPQPTPLICDLEAGGAIDASPFHDPVSGTLYLTWKIDGNSLGGGGPCGNADSKHSTPLRIAPLDPQTGTSFLGPATTLLDRGRYDGPLIEAPSLAYYAPENLYLLFFSSNCYKTKLYDTSYAVSRQILGPYVKAKKPLLLSGDFGGKLKSPGGAEVSADAGRIMFHADRKAGDASVREMWVGELRVGKGVVTI